MRSRTLGLAFSGVLAAGAFAVGGVHLAFADANTCSTGTYTGSQELSTGVPPVAGGVCVNLGSNPTGFQGGVVEAGVNPTGNGVVYTPNTSNPLGGPNTGTTSVAGEAVPGAYVVVDGNDGNFTTGPLAGSAATGSQGYVGVSDYETGGQSPNPQDVCASGGTSDSNSGGSVGVDPMCTLGVYPAGLPLPVACGHVSGNDWGSTTRDGCWEP